MCGLVATLSFDGCPADPILLTRMSDVLAHRGPDDAGLATYGPVGFGFRRLAILDLSPAGHQPMESADGQLAIVFNGEIYNYIEIRRELQSLGHTFRSSSDTEVLLHAYMQWGTSCVGRFNGMWAFVIFDKGRGRIFASRDRFGVKPLYRWSDGRRLILASEIKAILVSGWYRPDVNWSAAAKFLYRGHVDEGTETFFNGVEQVPAGTTLEVELDGRSRQQKFWTLPSVQRDVAADPIATFREVFEDSVRLRMRSDVPVGVCLSGGIDSSAIISMMAKLRNGGTDNPLQAFSYIPEEFSEADYIDASISQTRATPNVLNTNARELWDTLPSALWHYDEPVHSPTALIGFHLMRLAKSRGVTVVLNGQGADEVNAGYHAYFKTHWADLMHAGRWRRGMAEIREYSRVHERSYWPLVYETLNHWIRCELRRLPGSNLLRHGSPTSEAAAWFSPDLKMKLPAVDHESWAKPLSGVLADSVEKRPLPLYLRVEDRNSMAHSIEARLPFLDYRLVSLAFSLPGEWKLRGGWNKYFVREALKGVIAEPIRVRRDKMGFPTPSKDWWATAWFEPMMDLLGSRGLRESGTCDVERARRDLRRHANGEIEVANYLFRLAEFGTWLDGHQAVDGSTSRVHDSTTHLVASTQTPLGSSRAERNQHA